MQWVFATECVNKLEGGAMRYMLFGIGLCVAIISGAWAQEDTCANQLRQLNDADAALGTPMSCSSLAAAIRLEKAYAALYRRCLPGMEGEDRAGKYDHDAAGDTQGYKLMCGGSRLCSLSPGGCQ